MQPEHGLTNSRMVDGARRPDLAEYVDKVLNGEVDGVIPEYGLARDAAPSGTPKRGVVVIEDLGSAHGGTVFTPQDGKAYFDRLE